MAKKTSAKSAKSDATPADADDIFGLFLITFGQGVDPLHVNRDVVRAIRKRFRPSIWAALQASSSWRTDWKHDAASVLGWMAAIGRLSAQIAMEPKERRTVVNVEDFRTAEKVVTAEHGLPPERTGPVHPLGRWCN